MSDHFWGAARDLARGSRREAGTKALESIFPLVALVFLTKWFGCVDFTVLLSERNKCVPATLDILMFQRQYVLFWRGRDKL